MRCLLIPILVPYCITRHVHKKWGVYLSLSLWSIASRTMFTKNEVFTYPYPFCLLHHAPCSQKMRCLLIPILFVYCITRHVHKKWGVYLSLSFLSIASRAMFTKNEVFTYPYPFCLLHHAPCSQKMRCLLIPILFCLLHHAPCSQKMRCLLIPILFVYCITHHVHKKWGVYLSLSLLSIASRTMFTKNEVFTYPYPFCLLHHAPCSQKMRCLLIPILFVYCITRHVHKKWGVYLSLSFLSIASRAMFTKNEVFTYPYPFCLLHHAPCSQKMRCLLIPILFVYCITRHVHKMRCLLIPILFVYCITHHVHKKWGVYLSLSLLSIASRTMFTKNEVFTYPYPCCLLHHAPCSQKMRCLLIPILFVYCITHHVHKKWGVYLSLSFLSIASRTMFTKNEVFTYPYPCCLLHHAPCSQKMRCLLIPILFVYCITRHVHKKWGVYLSLSLLSIASRTMFTKNEVFTYPYPFCLLHHAPCSQKMRCLLIPILVVYCITHHVHKKWGVYLSLSFLSISSPTMFTKNEVFTYPYPFCLLHHAPCSQKMRCLLIPILFVYCITHHVHKKWGVYLSLSFLSIASRTMFTKNEVFTYPYPCCLLHHAPCSQKMRCLLIPILFVYCITRHVHKKWGVYLSLSLLSIASRTMFTKNEVFTYPYPFCLLHHAPCSQKMRCLLIPILVVYCITHHVHKKWGVYLSLSLLSIASRTMFTKNEVFTYPYPFCLFHHPPCSQKMRCLLIPILFVYCITHHVHKKWGVYLSLSLLSIASRTMFTKNEVFTYPYPCCLLHHAPCSQKMRCLLIPILFVYCITHHVHKKWGVYLSLSLLSIASRTMFTKNEVFTYPYPCCLLHHAPCSQKMRCLLIPILVVYCITHHVHKKWGVYLSLSFLSIASRTMFTKSPFSMLYNLLPPGNYFCKIPSRWIYYLMYVHFTHAHAHTTHTQHTHTHTHTHATHTHTHTHTHLTPSSQIFTNNLDQVVSTIWIWGLVHFLPTGLVILPVIGEKPGSINVDILNTIFQAKLWGLLSSEIRQVRQNGVKFNLPW